MGNTSLVGRIWRWIEGVHTAVWLVEVVRSPHFWGLFAAAGAVIAEIVRHADPIWIALSGCVVYIIIMWAIGIRRWVRRRFAGSELRAALRDLEAKERDAAIACGHAFSQAHLETGKQNCQTYAGVLRVMDVHCQKVRLPAAHDFIEEIQKYLPVHQTPRGITYALLRSLLLMLYAELKRLGV